MSELSAAAFGRKGAGGGGPAASRLIELVRRLRPALTPPNRPTTQRPRVAPLVAVIEAVLAILIGILAAKAFWALFGPLPVAPSAEIATTAPRAVPSGAAIDPFRLTFSAEAPAADIARSAPVAVETSLNLTLFGTWSDAGGGGTAIISANGETQKVFRIGEEICCGASLSAVYPDRVLISRAGAQETLRLPNKIEQPTSGAPQQAATVAPASGPRAFIGDFVNVFPSNSVDGKFALQLAPGNDEARFRALGLRSGDLLLAVDGQTAPQDPAAAEKLLSVSLRARNVTLTIEREGVSLPVEINLGAPVEN